MRKYFAFHWPYIVIKFGLYSVSLLAVFLGVLVLPNAIALEVRGDFDYLIIMILFYATIVPLLVALYRTHTLLRAPEGTKQVNIIKKRARSIRTPLLLISALYVLAAPYVYYLAQMDDAPGLFALGILAIAMPLFFAAIAEIFARKISKN